MSEHEKKRRAKVREYVIWRDGSICIYCDMPLTDETITLEHILPDSKGGTSNSTNLTIACLYHNQQRGNKPFFEYCQQFSFSDEKIAKFRALYCRNLRIKVLNIAKEVCLTTDIAIPNVIIEQACQMLKIKTMSFSDYENEYPLDIEFDEACERRRIKFVFEQLIRIIEMDNR